MDLVLGVSVTSVAVHWVLVQGATGQGVTVDRGVADLADVRGAQDRDVAEAVFGREVLATAHHNRLRAAGVVWSASVATEASTLLAALAAAGFDNVLAVADEPATTALATRIEALAEHHSVGVCVVEPERALAAIADPNARLLDIVDRPCGDGATQLAAGLAAALRHQAGRPQVVLTVGSAHDLNRVAAELDRATDVPVISAQEAPSALARGAAMAAARTLDGIVPPGTPQPVGPAGRWAVFRPGRRPWVAPTSRALTPVVVAAALTLVAALSAALSLRVTPQVAAPESEQRQVSVAADAAGDPLALIGAQAAAPGVAAPLTVDGTPLPLDGPLLPVDGPPPALDGPPPATKTITAAAVLAAPLSTAGRSWFEAPTAGPVPAPPLQGAPAPATGRGWFDPPAPAPIPPAELDGPVETVPGTATPLAPVSGPPPAAPVSVPAAPRYDPAPPRLRDRILERIPIVNRFHVPQGR